MSTVLQADQAPALPQMEAYAISTSPAELTKTKHRISLRGNGLLHINDESFDENNEGGDDDDDNDDSAEDDDDDDSFDDLTDEDEMRMKHPQTTKKSAAPIL